MIVKRLDSNHLTDVVKISRHIDEFVTTDDGDQWSDKELREWLSNPFDYCGGVFSDNRLVAYCLSHFHKETNKVHVENVFVEEDFRRRGAATLLMKALVEFYEDNLRNKLRFAGVVRTDNEGAHSFFEKTGFKRGYEFTWFQKDLPS